MPEPDDRIPRYLGALSRRERLLLGARAFVRAGSALFFGWAALTILVNYGLLRAHPSYGAWPLGLWALLPVVVLLVSLRGWRRAAELRRQAAAVETVKPELRGALLTVVDRESRPMGSPAILARLARRSADALAAVAPPSVWPSTPVRKSGRFAALSLLLLVLVGVLLPVGPVAAITTLLVKPSPVAPGEAPVTDARRMLIGDITVRYRYPDYTGLEPLEVPNSSGDVHAPPGTLVDITARSAIPVSTLGIQFDPGVSEGVDLEAEPVQPATVADGRSLAAQLQVVRSGAWRFLLDGVPSADYAVLVEPDLAPDVTARAMGNLLAVGLDQPLPLSWIARDDYGVREVVLEIKERGTSRSVAMRKPLDPIREISGVNELSPAALGLSKGASVKVRVGAWDNDAVTGSKAGWSAWIDVDVAGAYGTSERQRENRQQLRDALVLVLADTLVEPAPALSDRSGAAAWGQALDARYEAFDVLVAEVRASLSASLDGTAVRTVNEPRRALRAYVQALDAAEGRLSTADLEQLSTLQAAHIVGIEQAILFLDAVLQSSAASEVADLVSKVAQESEELKAELGDLSAQAALARLDQLARLLEKLSAATARLNEGATKEWLNARNQEINSLMEEIRKDIAAGRMEDAQAKMDRLAAALKEMADGMRDMEAKQKSGENKLGEAMKSMAKELEALQTEQTALRKETEQARDRHGPEMDQAAAAWEEIARRAGELAIAVRRNEETLPPTLALFSSSLSGATADAEGLRDSTRARDLDASRTRVSSLQDTLMLLGTRLDPSLQSRRSAPEGAARIAAAVASEEKEAAAIQELLDQMTSQSNASSPEMQQALQELAQKQQGLNERMEKASQKARELGQQLPMGAPGLESGTRDAAQQGERAKGAMQEGEPMEAEGGQRGAEAGLQEARDALGEAQRNMQQMQQASGRGKGEKDGEGEGGQKEGEGEGGEQNGDMDHGPAEIVLPKPEAFQTPEAYRKALLEGMSGEVPEEYKALNRRYYEELVRQ